MIKLIHVWVWMKFYMKQLLEDYNFCNYAFTHPWIQAMLLERCLIDQTSLLDLAKSGLEIDSTTLADYQRRIAFVPRHKYNRLPAEIYSFGYTQNDYEQNQFELDLIAAMRAGFRFNNIFFHRRQSDFGPVFQDRWLDYFSDDNKFLSDAFDFSFLRPIVDFHLKKSYQFGFACVRSTARDYAGVKEGLPKHSYATTLVCIDDGLYYLDEQDQQLILLDNPRLMTLMAGKDCLFTTFDEFPELLSSTPFAAIQLRKEALDRIQGQFLSDLKVHEQQLTSLNSATIQSWVQGFAAHYQAYQAQIHEIFAEQIYPKAYLQDIEILPLQQQMIPFQPCFAQSQFDAFDQADLLKSHVCNIGLALTQHLDLTSKKASFAKNINGVLNLSDLEGEALSRYLLEDPNLSLLRDRCQHWYQQFLRTGPDWSQSPLDILAAYNVVLGQMQLNKLELLETLEQRGIDPVEQGLAIEKFERATIEAVSPIIRAYLAGKMSSNLALQSAAAEIDLDVHYQKKYEALEQQKQLVQMKAQSTTMDQSLIQSHRQIRFYALLSVGLALTSLGMVFSFGGLLPIIGIVIGLGVGILSLYRATSLRQVCLEVSRKIVNIENRAQEIEKNLQECRKTSQKIQNTIRYLMPALQVWPSQEDKLEPQPTVSANRLFPPATSDQDSLSVEFDDQSRASPHL